MEDKIMTLVRLNNWMPELNHVMNNLFDRSPLFDNNCSSSSIPMVNIYETENDFQIEVAAPGYKKKDFSIEVNDGVLKLKAEKEDKGKEGFWVRKKSFGYSSFERSFTLPKNIVDDSKIEASYEDGILLIAIAKREEAKPKPARMIDVA